jgi:hypothetical protein
MGPVVGEKGTEGLSASSYFITAKRKGNLGLFDRLAQKQGFL